MAAFEQAVSIEGLRRISVRLSRGDIGLHRIDGDAVVIEADGALQCEREGDSLTIGLSRPHPFQPQHKESPPRRRFVSGLGEIGELIDDVVTRSLDSVLNVEFLLGGGSDNVRIGIPPALERPVLDATTNQGDIHLDGIHAVSALRTGSGDITVRHAGGSLELTSGVGDLVIEGFTGVITANTGSGDIEFADCLEGGSVHTGSGDVQGRRLAGNWRLHSGSGDIQVHEADAASFTIGTGAGDVTVAGGSTDQLQVQSGSGDIEIKSVLLGEQHRLSTGNGDVTLGIADPPGARLQIITRSGSVHSAYPLVMVGKQGPQTRGSARYVGKIGDSNVNVEVRTGSGDVRVSRLDPSPFTRVASSVGGAGTAYKPGVSPDAAPATSISPATAEQADVAEWEQSVPISDDLPEPAPPFTYTPGPSPKGDPRLRILESLKKGEISIEEASMLIGALEKGNA